MVTDTSGLGVLFVLMRFLPGPLQPLRIQPCYLSSCLPAEQFNHDWDMVDPKKMATHNGYPEYFAVKELLGWLKNLQTTYIIALFLVMVMIIGNT